MASSLSSLGIGSDGVLSYDVLDQLRKADESAQITPIDKNLEENKVQQADLSTLTTLAATLKSSTSTLADEISYLQRKSTSSDEAVSVSVDAGTSIQDFNIHVNELAQNDVYQSSIFSSQTALFANGDDTLTISTGSGTTYDIAVSAGTTLSELKDKINESLDGVATASILNVGEDEYRLIIKGDETGSENSISISSTGKTAIDLGLGTTTYTGTAQTGSYGGAVNDMMTFTINGTDYNVGIAPGDDIQTARDRIENQIGDLIDVSVENDQLVITSQDANMSVTSRDGSHAFFGLDSLTSTQDSHLQTARDASFDFNGISITRSSNTISDLIVGVNIELKAPQDVGEKANISVTQDWTTVKDSLNALVSQYNDLMNNLNEATKYDSDADVAGTFQGNSEINGLKSALGREILKVDEFGRSLIDYGVKLNEAGMLEFSESTLDEKISEDPSDVEDFLRGSISYDTTSLSSTTISAGDLDISGTDFSINGTEISINTVGLGNDANANALAVLEAINSAGISGVEAFINPDGTSIRLAGSEGVDIQVSGNTAALSSIGLRETNVESSSTSREGAFTSFNSLMETYIGSSNGLLTLFDTRLQNEQDALKDERLKSVESLNTKYETMAARFAAYDSIINKLNNQFQSLSRMIDAEAND